MRTSTPDGDGDTLALGEIEADGLKLGLGLLDGVLDGDNDGETDGLGLLDGDNDGLGLAPRGPMADPSSLAQR